ncbi:hypothetical protein SAMN06295909_3474 [Plantibacter sp. VKM Ac-1784]|uniref:Uncharacterized protein n=1 Tax=Plantibacter elymi (nom. nud.) TaxID=199708 RepID=A0ABY1RHT4_9MICO|nr:hypothetical protein [Plantibacter sp. VKM Ac-1784]SMQ73888.1 hypothetical protein SAMN06295909_3474 [Plantibacter sp. VKM Ac-1784]
MRWARRKFVAVFVALTAIGVSAASTPQQSEAAWQSAGFGAATFGALTVPKPVYLPGANGCSISATSVLGIGLVLNSYTLTFTMPEGYGAADIQVGSANQPAAGVTVQQAMVLASVANTPMASAPTPNPNRQYSLTFNRGLLDGLLTGLLGGTGYLGVRTAPASYIVSPVTRDQIWASQWAIVQVSTGALASNPTCTIVG